MTATTIPCDKLSRLTKRQGLYYLAIVNHIREFHSFPTMIELALLMGVFPNAAVELIQRLCKKGVIEQWCPRKYRVKGAKFEPIYSNDHGAAYYGQDYETLFPDLRADRDLHKNHHLIGATDEKPREQQCQKV